MKESRYLAFYQTHRVSKPQVLRRNALIAERYLELNDIAILLYKNEEHTNLVKEIYIKDILYLEIGVAVLPFLLRHYSSFSMEVRIICLQEIVTTSFLYHKNACQLIEDLKTSKIPIMDPVSVLNFVSVNSTSADRETFERHFKRYGPALAKKYKQVNMRGSILDYNKD